VTKGKMDILSAGPTCQGFQTVETGVFYLSHMPDIKKVT
jgi:hypothetical protein